MRDSDIEWLGMVPAHWEVKKLKYVAKNIIAGPFGSSLKKEIYVKEGYKVYGQEQVIPADFAIGDYYISEELYSEMARYKIEPGDILISCVGTFGKIAVVPQDAHPGIINPRLVKLQPILDVISSNYLGFLLKSNLVYQQLEQLSRGGTMGVINISLLSELILPFPTSIKEQQDILSFINIKMFEIDRSKSKIEEEISLLHEYRTALISEAVTGKIDVREYQSEALSTPAFA